MKLNLLQTITRDLLMLQVCSINKRSRRHRLSLFVTQEVAGALSVAQSNLVLSSSQQLAYRGETDTYLQACVIFFTFLLPSKRCVVTLNQRLAEIVGWLRQPYQNFLASSFWLLFPCYFRFFSF